MTDREENGRPAPSLTRQVEKLSKINAVLMDRVERSMDQQGSAYALFQTAIALEAKVRSRTEELVSVLRRLERTNDALIVAKEEAERANLSKTRFLAAASHDLLQPLNAAKLSISVLGDMQATPETQALAGKVERSLETIEGLIKTLLDISKLDAGVVKAECAAVAVDDILAGLAGGFEPLAAVRGLRLRVRPSGLLIETDPALLARVLQNLVSNAVSYTQRGGVLIGARRRGAVCWIDVIDTGSGIAESERGRIFDEFYRGAASAEGGHAGLGLGLAIVERTVRALGAGLEVHSRLGHGSTFRVIVPCIGRIREPAPATPETPGWPAVDDALAGRTVLVIENDGNMLDAMVSLLARWPCRTRVARAASGLDASAPPPDIVIADYHLDDGETGLEAIAALRARRPGLPALVVTADYSGETAARVREAGCELLQKPVKPAELRALMTHLLAQGRAGAG